MLTTVIIASTVSINIDITEIMMASGLIILLDIVCQIRALAVEWFAIQVIIINVALNITIIQDVILRVLKCVTKPSLLSYLMVQVISCPQQVGDLIAPHPDGHLAI